jgi:hypothetical protein
MERDAVTDQHARRNRPGAPVQIFRLQPIVAAFSEYEATLANRCFKDPRGVEVWFYDYNFPKLIQLAWKPGPDGDRLKLMASRVIKEIRSGRFAEDQYEWDNWRLGTLFWTPDVIQDPDKIHPNAHPLVFGDTVYVRRYAKAGDPYKLAFTARDERHKTMIVTTSFWVPGHRVRKFAKEPPLWEKQWAGLAASPLCP